MREGQPRMAQTPVSHAGLRSDRFLAINGVDRRFGSLFVRVATL